MRALVCGAALALSFSAFAADQGQLVLACKDTISPPFDGEGDDVAISKAVTIDFTTRTLTTDLIPDVAVYDLGTRDSRLPGSSSS